MSVPQTLGDAALTDGKPETETRNGPLEERGHRKKGTGQNQTKGRRRGDQKKRQQAGCAEDWAAVPSEREGLRKGTETQAAVAGVGSEVMTWRGGHVTGPGDRWGPAESHGHGGQDPALGEKS